jgi:hypothetical protein
MHRERKSKGNRGKQRTVLELLDLMNTRRAVGSYVFQHFGPGLDRNLRMLREHVNGERKQRSSLEFNLGTVRPQSGH